MKIRSLATFDHILGDYVENKFCKRDENMTPMVLMPHPLLGGWDKDGSNAEGAAKASVLGSKAILHHFVEAAGCDMKVWEETCEEVIPIVANNLDSFGWEFSIFQAVLTKL